MPTDEPPRTTSVRPARPDDVVRLAVVWRDAWRDGHVGHVPAALLAERDDAYFVVRLESLVGSTLVAISETGSVLGLVVVVEDEVVQLAVSDLARGRGVGAALTDAAERRIATTHGRAWLAVVPGNVRARRFYERLGWQDEGPTTYDAPTRSGTTTPVPVHVYAKVVSR